MKLEERILKQTPKFIGGQLCFVYEELNEIKKLEDESVNSFASNLKADILSKEQEIKKLEEELNKIKLSLTSDLKLFAEIEDHYNFVPKRNALGHTLTNEKGEYVYHFIKKVGR